jgi:hypothetical protein
MRSGEDWTFVGKAWAAWRDGGVVRSVRRLSCWDLGSRRRSLGARCSSMVWLVGICAFGIRIGRARTVRFDYTTRVLSLSLESCYRRR